MIADRFELLVNGQELVNAYLELNDPQQQRERFKMQKAEGDQGNDEVHHADEDFCLALEYGLPPTAGWGLGVDRFIMLLTDNSSIKEVIAYPFTRNSL